MSFKMMIMNDNRYIKVLDAYYDVMSLDEGDRRSVNSTDKAIEINCLKYQYPQSGDYELNGININLKIGKKIVLVGYNGSGKPLGFAKCADRIKAEQEKAVFDKSVNDTLLNTRQKSMVRNCNVKMCCRYPLFFSEM